MGDAGDHADVGRFMRTPEGAKVLERFRQGLVGKRIADVQFHHNTAGVGIVLTFEDRDLLDLGEAVEAFSVDTLRRRYMRILDREYYVDFPRSSLHYFEFQWRLAGGALRMSGVRRERGFCIEAWQRLTYYPDGTVTEGDEGQQWDADSACCCESCLHEGVVGDFLPDSPN